MAKKKQQESGDNDMSAAAPAEAASSRKGSRHKPRKMVSFSARAYDLLSQLARKNKRPVAWEARIAVNNALVEAGLMTQEEADLVEVDDEDE